jgi:hypothetical protein
MSLFNGSPAFAVVAGRTCGNQIIPFMFATLAAWDNMIDCELGGCFSAVLAGEIVPAKDLALIQFDPDAWSFDHPFQPYNGWSWKFLGYSANKTAPIKDQRSFTGHHQADRAPRGANIQRLKIRIQD